MRRHQLGSVPRVSMTLGIVTLWVGGVLGGTLAVSGRVAWAAEGLTSRQRALLERARRKWGERDKQEREDRKRWADKKKKTTDEAAKKAAARAKERRQVTLKLIKELYQKAKEAEKNENWSAAYQHFDDVSQATVAGATKMVSESKSRVLEIERMVDRMLLEGITKERLEDYPGAAAIYNQIITSYSFHRRAYRRARQRLVSLERTPRSGALIAMVEAELLEQSGQFSAARRAYAKIIDDFPEEVPALKSRMRLEHFRRDPEIAAALKADRDAKAQIDCPKWLNLADNFMLNDRPQRAREYLERIIEAYPQTDFATQARAKVAALPD